MTTNIYDQHRAAFANVSAYVVLKDGKRVATVAFKFPRDGAGRLYAYVQWFGATMVRGHANGYGYDKRTAAASVAARKLQISLEACIDAPARPEDHFVAALWRDAGDSWDRALEHAGFEVVQAV
jgi:hypothetical protein